MDFTGDTKPANFTPNFPKPPLVSTERKKKEKLNPILGNEAVRLLVAAEAPIQRRQEGRHKLRLAGDQPAHLHPRTGDTKSDILWDVAKATPRKWLVVD